MATVYNVADDGEWMCEVIKIQVQLQRVSQVTFAATSEFLFHMNE